MAAFREGWSGVEMAGNFPRGILLQPKLRQLREGRSVSSPDTRTLGEPQGCGVGTGTFGMPSSMGAELSPGVRGRPQTPRGPRLTCCGHRRGREKSWRSWSREGWAGREGRWGQRLG